MQQRKHRHRHPVRGRADLLPQGTWIQHDRGITPAKACSPCNSVPLDIQLVVDRTGSMSASGGSSNGQNKWQNLQQGLLQGFLPGLDSSIDNVGLTTLPPDVNGTNDMCQAASSNNYDSTHPTYTVVPLSNSYMDNAGNLIASSPLVSDINCMKPGGGTDYADAMAAAYTELNLHGRPGVQKIIVLLSTAPPTSAKTASPKPSTASRSRIRIRTASSPANRP